MPASRSCRRRRVHANAIAVFLTPQTQLVPFPNRPPGARSNGYEEYFVQDLVIHGTATLYLRERIVTVDGQYLPARDFLHFMVCNLYSSGRRYSGKV